MDNLQKLKNITLLYAEDDLTIQKQYYEIFSNFFNKVFTANNGIEALNIYNKENIHIMVTDIKMPLMDGLTLIEEIRKENENIPIFITSSYSEKEYLLKAIKFHLVDYIIQPATYSAIKETLLKALHTFEKTTPLDIIINDKCSYSFVNRTIHFEGKVLLLPNKEAQLLELLLKNKQKLVTKEMIEYELYPNEIMSESGLKNLIFKLRQKIGHNTILTVKNGGYILQ